MTSPDMTAVPFGVSRLKRAISWSLDSRKTDSRNADGLSLRYFPRGSRLLPRVPSRWTVLVVSRFHDLRHPMTEILCQLETPVADMPTVSSMFATCPNKWTTVIFSRFRDLRCRDFAYRGFGEQSPSLVQLPIPDFAIGSDRRLTIFRIQRSRITRDFAIREFSRQSSDLYTLRVSEMPRSRHVFLDGRSK
jgi:hypothetical protein